MQLILVGDDGSRAAAHAVEWATRLAEERSAGSCACMSPAQENPTQSEERITRVTLRDSHPASAIMETAEDRDADLIVLGRRGSGGFPSLPIGTTAHHVAAASGRPVAVVPPVEHPSERPARPASRGRSRRAPRFGDSRCLVSAAMAERPLHRCPSG